MGLIFLGCHKGKKIFVNPDEGINGHVLITGSSGTGKSNFLKNYLDQAECDYLGILDFSGSFVDFVGTEKLDVCCSSLLQNFFQNIDMKDIGMVADAIQATFRFGLAQRSTLLKALVKMQGPIHQTEIMPNAENSIFFRYLSFENDEVVKDWANLAFILDTECGKEGIRLASRLFEIVVAFYGKRLQQEEKEGVTILVFPIESISLSAIFVELYLWKIWQRQIYLYKEGIKRKVILVLDECQNLNWKKGSIAEKILSEGRKFGISLVLSTQFVSMNFPKRVVTSFTQSGMRVIFSPPEAEICEIAHSLDSTGWKNWLKVLRNLRRGTCIVSGNLHVNDWTCRQKIVVQAPLYGEEGIQRKISTELCKSKERN